MVSPPYILGVSFFFNITPFRHSTAQFLIYGQLLQVVIVLIMTIIFLAPLLKIIRSSSISKSLALYDVIRRTFLGAAIHVSLTVVLVTFMMIYRYDVEEVSGNTSREIAIYAYACFPTILHIGISHRDDKPFTFLFSTLCHSAADTVNKRTTQLNAALLNATASSPRATANIRFPMKFNLKTYLAVALFTFESENSEMRQYSTASTDSSLFSVVASDMYKDIDYERDADVQDSISVVNMSYSHNNNNNGNGNDRESHTQHEGDRYYSVSDGGPRSSVFTTVIE
jgi:hypothetical protein